ncbi:MAG TPA: DJ-1/PfpI family protein [Thermoanaerobaculia bacterium]|nr:DJ-1/PfpI family protein [Thermoanaerobaculia bacterium]
MNRIRSLAAVSLFALALLTGACRAADPEGSGEETAAAASPTPAPSPAPVAPGPPPPAPSPVAAPAALPQDRPLRAGFLVVDGVYNSELMAPYDVFQHTTFHVKPGIEVFTVSPDGQPVTTSEGLRLTPHHSFANAPAMDILVVPSTRGSMDADLRNQALIDWVRRTAGTARHVVGLCDGAFVLAQAGLLDGVPATTFPEDYQRLSQMFPRVDLRVNVSFVDAGKILTSQGGARSYDVAMHLVDQLYGPQVAQGVGRGLVIPWPPDPDTMVPRVVEHPPTAPPASSPAASPAAPAPGTGAAPPPA